MRAGADRRILSAAALAFAFALSAGALHTRVTWSAFGPALQEGLAFLFPWGPYFSTEWARHAGRLLAAGFFFLSLPGLGARLLGPWRERYPDPFLRAGLALVFWSLVGFALAAAGWSRAPVLRVLSVALAAIGLSGTRTWPYPFPPVSFLLRLGLGVVAAFYVLTTAVPETFYDALVYHLAAPQLWLQTGSMADMPDIHLWRLPGLMQTLYLWALAWGDDRLCKILTLGVGFLAAGLFASWTARRWPGSAGPWAALLFLTSPMIGVNLWSCANDIPAGFFLFLAFALWLGAWEEERPAASLALSGLFLGAAAAAKYTALFSAPYFALDLLLNRRRPGRVPWREGALFAAGALLPLAPWWIRGALWTGNPFYPEAAGLLGGDIPENIALLADWKSDTAGAGGLFHRALSLVRESVQGVEAGRFGFVGPSLLAFLPLLLFVRPSPAVSSLLGCGLVSYVFYTAVSGRLRYFIPQLGFGFVLAAAALDGYRATLSGLGPSARAVFFRRAMPALAGALAVLNLFWLALVFQRFNQGWDVVWGRASPAEYLRREHIGVYGHPSQGAFDFLKKEGGAGRVFVVGEARTFRCPLPARASGNFNVPTYGSWFRDAPSPADFLARLKAEGFTYLLVNAPEMKRITPELYRSGEPLERLGRLMDSLPPPVFRDAWTILFRLP